MNCSSGWTCRYAPMATRFVYRLFVLQAVARGHRFGFDIRRSPSWRAARCIRRWRLETPLVASDWENEGRAREARPRGDIKSRPTAAGSDHAKPVPGRAGLSREGGKRAS